MAHRPHGRARVDSKRPEAFAVCDRCGIIYNQVDLRFQYDWRGNQLVNTNILVCTVTCYDEPYEGRRPLKLPEDPTPIRNARPVRYAADGDGFGPQPAGQLWDEPGILWDDGQTEWQ